jgi:hypothetical protein
MAQPNTSPPKKRQFLFNPLKRPMPYIGLILGLLIIIFQGTLRQYTANVVGGWLINSLKSSTEGNYTLSYDFVRFDIFTKELRIQNLELHLDTTVIQEEEYLENYSNLVDVSTPLAVLKLESLWDLIVNDKLRVAFIGLKEPNFDLIRSESLSEEENEENKQQTTEKIRAYLNEIEVDSIRILNGSLSANLQNASREDVVGFKVGNFSTLLRGFELSEISSKRFFQGIYVDKVELEVLDQQIEFAQFNHRLGFKRLWISSEDSVIQLDSIKLKPIVSGASNTSGQLELKQIALTSIDFRKAYDDFILDIGNFAIDKADLAVLKEVISSQDVSSEINLTNVPFKALNIGNFEIKNSSVNLQLKRKMIMENINFQLKDFTVDSTAASIQDIVSGLDNFEFHAINSTLELPDSIHQASIRSIDINSASSDIIVKNISINPIEERRKYSLYKERGAKRITYGTIRQLLFDGVNFDELIQNQQLLVDSLYIVSPNLNITEYPYIIPGGSQKDPLSYLIKKAYVSNGTVKHNLRKNSRNNRTEATGINIDITNLFPENTINPTPTFDNMVVQVMEGYTQLNDIKHIVRFNNLRSNNLRRFDVSVIEMQPDSTFSSGNQYKLKSSGLSLIAYDRGFLTNTRKIELEELSAQSFQLDIHIDKKSQRVNRKGDYDELTLNRFYFNNGRINYSDSTANIVFNDVATFVDSLHYDLNDTINAIPIEFKDLRLSHNSFEIDTEKFYVSGKKGQYSEKDSLISYGNIEYSNKNGVSGGLEKLELNGLAHKTLLSHNRLKFNHLLLDNHSHKMLISSPDSGKVKLETNVSEVKKLLLSNFTSINIDSITYLGGEIEIAGKDRNTDILDLNFLISKYYLDSLSADSTVFRPKNWKINISKIRSSGTKDTVEVNGLSLDLIKRTLFTGNIEGNVTNSNSTLTYSSPGVVASGFKLSNIIEEDYSFDTLLLANSVFKLNVTSQQNDTKSITTEQAKVNSDFANLFNRFSGLNKDSVFTLRTKEIVGNPVELDSSKNVNFRKFLGKLNLTKNNDPVVPEVAPVEDSVIQINVMSKAIPTNGRIHYIGLENSRFELLENNIPRRELKELKFSVVIDGLLLDSLNQFNVYNHFENVQIELYNYQYVFPDSLNKVGFKKLSYSTTLDIIDVEDISFTPLVDRYEYANKVGHQAGWHWLQDIDLNVKSLDIHKLINDKILLIRSLNTHNGTLDIFKDKELPIPVNQRRPMLQTSIRNIPIPIKIDSVNVNDFHVNFTSRLSSSLPEGSLNFHEINATTTNLTNIDTLIYYDPNLRIYASAKIMGKGLLTANFDFDLGDPDQRFIFDGHLTPMSAREFNSLLEATAYVSIESGNIKEIELAAEGDENYAMGNMVFEYSNLKVSTITKKNLKTTGMGKVIKTFFANAFVVKKNNPTFKFFPRSGAMYFERDPQRIVIDYIAKTAMSGIVSSIGARNVRKDIKRIQNESKKEKDAQRKALKKANRESTIP